MCKKGMVIKMKDQKRILTVQDISCVGQCSLTVALPILSACGVETAIIPSAVLSTHTGNWTGFTFRDLTDDMPDITRHWEENNILFDGIYTGYIGNARQFDMINVIREKLRRPAAPVIIDPAMADHGKLYYGFDDDFVAGMRGFAAGADYLLPNITEASFLTGMDYREKYDVSYIEKLARETYNLGVKNVLITGVSFEPAKLGICIYDGSSIVYHFEDKLEMNCHGTGDVYASVFTGKLITGSTAFESGKAAAVFTRNAMLNTPAEHAYGVNFESILGELTV